jgi:hypothetical protein
MAALVDHLLADPMLSSQIRTDLAMKLIAQN